MRLTIWVISYPDPGPNSCIQSKIYRTWSDTTKGSIASSQGCTALPKERGQSSSTRGKKLGTRAENTLGFLFVSHPSLQEHFSFSKGRADSVLLPGFDHNPALNKLPLPFTRTTLPDTGNIYLSWLRKRSGLNHTYIHFEERLLKLSKMLSSKCSHGSSEQLPDHQPWGTIKCKGSLLFYIFLQLEIIKYCCGKAVLKHQRLF